MIKDSIATNARSHINISNPTDAFFLLKRHLKSRGRVVIQVEMVLNGMAPLSVLGGCQGALLARADSG